MMGIKFMGKPPFSEVYIHALVRDVEGKKMSKSKGNVIDPLTVMDQYGTDAFRFTLAALCVQGRDIRLAEERIKGYRNFANKIWNASRFVLMHAGTCDPGRERIDPGALSLADRWIQSRLNRLMTAAEEAFRGYQFNEAAHALYQFIWHELCDWYLEMVKPVLNQPGDTAEKRAAQHTMVEVLDASLRMLHPLMPFITEEIWQKLPVAKESIMIASYPVTDFEKIDAVAEETMGLVIDVVNSIRALRWEMNIAPAQQVDIVLRTAGNKSLDILNRYKGYIENLAKAGTVAAAAEVSKPESAVTAVVREVEIFLPLKGVIDFAEEQRRLQKELVKIQKDLSDISRKLSNRDFLAKAPEAVIEKEKARSQELIETRDKLQANLDRIEAFIQEGTP
jgi:valyl-tRNA synthetase